MTHVIQTEALVAEGILNRAQADEIVRRSRDTMLSLIVNILLTGGIVAAALGFVFWIADPLGVALLGGIFLAIGSAILSRGTDLYRMLGNAAALIGAGMLFAGAGFELTDKYRDIAHLLMIPAGAATAALAAIAFPRIAPHLRFSTGAVGLLALALHLWGAGHVLEIHDVSGIGVTAFSLYAALAIALAGLFVDVRFVTALAIVPFAQALNTSTAYFHAAYVFYSPEPTLTILQMGALVALCLYALPRLPDRITRHTGILAIMAAVVGALAFLVGSLWGDHVGMSFFRDSRPMWSDYSGYESYQAARAAWEAQFFLISETMFTVVFAVILIVGAWIAAIRTNRGMFNTAITFLGIHGYTQVFESFSDEPMAWALGGLALVPAAWGMWRLNAKMFPSA